MIGTLVAVFCLTTLVPLLAVLYVGSRMTRHGQAELGEPKEKP